MPVPTTAYGVAVLPYRVDTLSPGGEDSKFSVTVRGCRSTPVDEDVPVESVAVRRSSR